MADEQGAGEHYDMTTLHSTDSRTRLHHPQEGKSWLWFLAPSSTFDVLGACPITARNCPQ